MYFVQKYIFPDWEYCVETERSACAGSRKTLRRWHLRMGNRGLVHHARKWHKCLCVLHRKTGVHVAIHTILQSDENKH